MAHGLGRCYYVAVERPNPDSGDIKGAYDDVVWVQLARHRLQMMLMNGVDQAINAPLVVPDDVGDVPRTGPGSIIRTRSGVSGVGRAQIQMPAQAFGAVQQLAQEQREGSMSPEARGGSIDASVITGRGVQQLMQGFSTQIAVAQTILKAGIKRAIALAFLVDEMCFGDMTKELRGNDAGVPYSLKYRPHRDIDGDHTIDVSYGFAAGLDPNRALIFLLQADGAGLVSKDFVRRNLPVDLNAAEEEQKIAVEQQRQSLVQAMSAYVQSIPQLAASGMDPAPVVAQAALVVKLLAEGRNIEDVIVKVFAPKPPPEVASRLNRGPPAEPGANGPAAGASGSNDSGLPGQMKVGQATQGQNGRPPLNMMFAGITGSGNPQLSGGVSRMTPVGT